MLAAIDAQITELQQVHPGLAEIEETENEILLSGPLPFEASADGYDPITDSFEIELIIIPNAYPETLPRVRETGGKIDSSYAHLYSDRSLCLAVPIEERRLFLEQPSLLGFVNKLVIPYLFGYCHWKQHGIHPFDEQEHGPEGIAQHYINMLELDSEIEVLAVICFLYEHGYRGHHPCPCGSGVKVRKCHGKALRTLHEEHTDHTLQHDFISLLDVCCKKIEAKELHISPSQRFQVRRILSSTHSSGSHTTH